MENADWFLTYDFFFSPYRWHPCFHYCLQFIIEKRLVIALIVLWRATMKAAKTDAVKMKYHRVGHQ